ncbi:MAG: hypothetical protein VKJ06_02365 [Vampirovibrionales bacterium]|nr:hypothetical protein [Vampirovibrionales bacterium]
MMLEQGVIKEEIIKIGGFSQGIRIPKPILDLCGLQKQVRLEVREGQIIISAVEAVDDSLEKP